MGQPPAIEARERRASRLALTWYAAAGVLVACALALVAVSGRFASGTPLAQMPILTVVVGGIAVGMVALLLIPLARASETLPPRDRRRVLVVIVIAGLAARLLMLGSQPVLEVDFNRYLWDGAMTANGFNPYAVAPARIGDLHYADRRLELSRIAGEVFDGISYPEFKTIYPPVAQAAFALAYAIAPFSLTAWRAVAILADVVTLVLLLRLLAATGRSPLWSALYWWCPLAVKEIANSAHMEAVLLPWVLGALLLAVRGRQVAAIACLTGAIGVKLWPVMLVPLLIRPLLAAPRRLLLALSILVMGGALIAAPIWIGGLDRSSGFVAFAADWATNSALFPALVRTLAGLMGTSDALIPGQIVRFGAALAVFALSCRLAMTAPATSGDLVSAAYRVVSLLLLLSPAQFPWYVLWVLPLAALNPGLLWHVAAATLWGYYAAFHLLAQQRLPVFEQSIVWLIWMPVWMALAVDIWRRRSAPKPKG